MPHDLSALPAAAEALLDRALARYAERRIAEAVALFDQSLRLGLDPERGAAERWMSYMLAGRFEAAWREGDRAMARRRAAGERCDDRPLHLRWVWDGRPLDGRHVLVRCYHGLGDTIQFLRYARPLRARARAVAVQAPRVLLPLLRTLDGVDRLVPLED